MCACSFIATSLDRPFSYSNMTVFLCDKTSIKEEWWFSQCGKNLDWSAERQILIPAEHLCCYFKCRPWAKNSSPNTNDLYIHYIDKSTGTPSLEEKKRHCGTNKLMDLTIVFPPLLQQQFWSVWNDCHPYVLSSPFSFTLLLFFSFLTLSIALFPFLLPSSSFVHS